MGTILPCLQHGAWLIHHSVSRLTVLFPRQGNCPALQSFAALLLLEECHSPAHAATRHMAMGRALPCSLLQGWFSHTSANRDSSIVLPKQSVRSVLPLLWSPGQFSHLPQVLMGLGEWASFPCPYCHKTDKKYRQFPHVSTLGLFYPHLANSVSCVVLPRLYKGPAFQCCSWRGSGTALPLLWP